MNINGKMEANISCKGCRKRHPATLTCAQAAWTAAQGRFTVEQCVSLNKAHPVQHPFGTTKIPKGQCGVILALEPGGLVKVSFGDIGTFWIDPTYLGPMETEAEPANAGIPTHVEIPMPAQAVRELATLAIDIALGCPLDRPSQPGYYTYVNRDTVREIRRVLEAAGIPWKLQHKELRK